MMERKGKTEGDRGERTGTVRKKEKEKERVMVRLTKCK